MFANIHNYKGTNTQNDRTYDMITICLGLKFWKILFWELPCTIGKSLDNTCTNRLVNRSPAFRPRRRRGPGATFRGTTPDVFGCILDLSLGTSEKEIHSFLTDKNVD